MVNLAGVVSMNLQVGDGEAGLRGARVLLARPGSAASHIQPLGMPPLHRLHMIEQKTLFLCVLLFCNEVSLARPRPAARCIQSLGMPQLDRLCMQSQQKSTSLLASQAPLR